MEDNPTKLTWLGHATVLVETCGRRLLTDPVLGRRVGMLRRVAPAVAPGAYAHIDGLLLSHLHGDHTDPPSLSRLAVSVVAAPHAATWLRARGRRDVRALGPGQTTTVAGIAVEATRARHDGRRWPVGPAADAVGFLIGRERSVYFAGDTDLFPEMEQLAGRVDVALLPVWGWGPTLGPGHLDPERAAEAAAIIRPRLAIPIHWGTLAVPWARPDRASLREPAEAFTAAVARRAPEVDVCILEPGAAIALGEVARV